MQKSPFLATLVYSPTRKHVVCVLMNMTMNNITTFTKKAPMQRFHISTWCYSSYWNVTHEMKLPITHIKHGQSHSTAVMS